MTLFTFNSNISFKKVFITVFYCILFFVVCNGLAGVFEQYYLKNIGNIYPSKYLFIGSSHMRSGIDAEFLSQLIGEPAAKIGLPGATTQDKEVLLKYYISEMGKPDILFYEIGGLMFNETRFVESSFKSLYPLMDNTIINHYVKSKVTFVDYNLEKYFKLLRYNGDPIVRVFRSIFGLGKDTFNNVINESEEDILNKLRIEFKERKQSGNPKMMRVFEDTLALARKNDIKVVLLYIPEYYVIEKYFDYSEVYDKIRKLAKEYGASVLDYNRQFQNDNRLFKDLDHLNSKGQREFTELLSSYIKKIKSMK